VSSEAINAIAQLIAVLGVIASIHATDRAHAITLSPTRKFKPFA
jgi:hypothetical protein